MLLWIEWNDMLRWTFLFVQWYGYLLIWLEKWYRMMELKWMRCEVWILVCSLIIMFNECWCEISFKLVSLPYTYLNDW